MSKYYYSHSDDYERERFTTPKGVSFDCYRRKGTSYRPYLDAKAKGVDVHVAEGDDGGLVIEFADVSIHVHGYEWEADWHFPDPEN